jgi:hypothetical protein
MKQALARDEAVEFPCGTLRRVEKHFSAWWDSVDDYPADRQPYTVEWEVEQASWHLLYGPDPEEAEEPAPACLVQLPIHRVRRGVPHGNSTSSSRARAGNWPGELPVCRQYVRNLRFLTLDWLSPLSAAVNLISTVA